MNRLDRLKERLAEAEAQVRAHIRKGQIIIPPLLQAKVDALKDEIAEEEAYLPKRLSELIDHETLTKNNLAEIIIKTHIAADYLTDCAMDLRTTLGKLGLEGCSLFPMIREIEKRASAFAAIVCHPDFAGLSDFMVTNDELIDGMHEVVNCYMEKHLKID